MDRFFICALVFMVFVSCAEQKEISLNQGFWLTELQVSESEVLPFNFKLSKKDNGSHFIEIYNAEEVITVDEINIKNDSIIIKMPVFEGYLAGTFTEDKIKGAFIKESLGRVVPFTSYFGTIERFRKKKPADFDSSGNWKTQFSPNTSGGYLGKGVFLQTGDKVTGTFRTTTGDYRYLEGRAFGDSLKLSAFDGGHAFLFTAKVNDSSLRGVFYSGNHFQEPFVAKKDASFELPNADSLTFLKKGYDRLDFSFPNVNGDLISLYDDEFKDKVVLVQIMGTWCPNCLDETRFYADYLKKNNTDPDLKVIALAFEYADTEEKAFAAIARLKKRVGITYPVLLAQYGTSDKKTSQQKLPMLNHILSYPTTVYIDKKGKVRKIHTGFNGPATGEKYNGFKSGFEGFVKGLLSEQP